MNVCKGCLFCLAMTAASAIPASAQGVRNKGEPENGAPRRYVAFDVDPNYETLLKNRSQMEKQMGPLKDLFKQIAADPKKFLANPDKIEDLQKNFLLEDPQLKKAVQDWIESDPNLKKNLRDLIKRKPTDRNPADMKQWQKKWESILDPAKSNPVRKDEPGKKNAPPTEPTNFDKPREDPLAGAAKKMMEGMEDSNLGDWLRKSPAWQRALGDLKDSMKNPTPQGEKWKAFADQLRMPDEKFWKFGAKNLDHLRDMPRPEMPRWNMNLGVPSLGRMALPILNGAAFPDVSAPSWPTVGNTAIWLSLVFLAAFAVLQWLRRSKRLKHVKEDRATLGSWPIRPELVSTRAELVRAFDYLALRKLGTEVKSWNHQAIARRWSEQSPPDAKIVSTLASLYEQARYTGDGTKPLPAGQREQARQSLLRLAEAF